MKTITLAVEGVADSEADNNEAIDIEIKGKEAGAIAIGRGVVEALQEAGVTVKSASLTIAPRQGTHEAATVVDLTVPEAPPAEEAPASEPAPA